MRPPRPTYRTIRLARPGSLVLSTWISSALLFGAVARAQTDATEDLPEQQSDAEVPAQAEPAPPRHGPSRWADDAPAPVDAPQLRNVEPRTLIYVDGSFAQTGDLSALPDIAGSGSNLRLAAGGSLKWRRFQFDAELPASQASTLDLVSPNPNIVIYPEDRHQTAFSIGDFRAGAQWTDALPIDAIRVVVGFGLRVRVPTHTTTFQFHDVAGNLGTYVLPYYFHVEPTLLFGEALGPVSFVMNQGALVLTGPDGSFGGIPFIVPNIFFWDAHYALALRMFDLLSASFEVNTTLQLNHVAGIDFQKVNDVSAFAIVPGLQLHLGRYRVDALARFGLTRGAELLGVIGYAGTRSFILRVSRVFD